MTTGTYWLAATGVVLLLWLLALANSATNNYILSFDLTLLDWVAQTRTLVLTDVMRGVHALGSLWTIRVLFWATVAVLLVTRRFRHLFVFVGAVVGVIALSSLLAYLFMRPRPLGVEILGDWTGAAHPSRPVFEFFDNARELGEAEVEVDEVIIDDGLRIIRRLWDAGLAHRDIKPANLLVRDGRVHLIDVFFAEVRPSPWRQAVDLANMMLVLATRSSPQQVYERARLQFNDDEIAEAFAATHGITMPSQLRQWMREQGRDLHKEFLKLLPERPHPISTQRWSIRRVGLLLGVLVLGLLVLLIVFSNLSSAGLL